MPIPTLSDVDRTTLTPIVRAVLESRSAEVVEWQVIPILQGRASPAGVYRVMGTAHDQGGVVPWSVVVKVLQAAGRSASVGNQASDDPTDRWYWKREILLFQSGLFNSLPDGFAAPRCFQLDDLPQEGRIWMEDVREDIGAVWPLEHYRHAARHFGRFNGVYLAGEPLPSWPWLMKDVLATLIPRSAWPEFWKNYPTLRNEVPLVPRGWSDELADGYNRIWEEREQFLQVLAYLPQTLLHNDAGRKNLFAHRRVGGDLETIAVDWGIIATGAIGEELAALVLQPVYWFNGVRPDQLSELGEIAFDGYLQGLRYAGWQGDSTLARLGYTASAALRGSFAILIPEWTARDEARRVWVENAIGHSMEEIVDTFRGLRGYVVACAEEARQLMASPVVKALA